MIIDTSALMAIILGEPGWETLRAALTDGPCCIPACVLTELQLVSSGGGENDVRVAEALLETLHAEGMKVASFEFRHAILTNTARVRYGKGNGTGGKLNFGDLMVYAIAKDRGEPLLCTGRDFASTDLVLHPASRIDP